MAKLITIKSFMDRYQVSRSTVYRLIKIAAISPVKIGRSTRIPMESVDAWERSLHMAANDNA